ncbi:MbtH family protein [Streptomyces fuscichromogenes]|uniref:MbtH family protein n=1 Tax=Streptomyces fuscichromogenes TaxID=1324013 RepID=UPI0037F9165A
MSTNPFDSDRSGAFLVLVNDQNQHSLWPSELPVPDGWAEVSRGSRQECLSHVDSHWIDMRPAGLIEARSG